MRFRLAAFFGVSAACAVAIGSACIPDLITDAAPVDGAVVPILQQGHYCGDGVITVGEYDGGFTDLDAGEECDPGAIDASVSGCTAGCQITCANGFVDPLNGHCYFVIDGGATSLNDGTQGAEAACEGMGAHAVTLADDRERDLVIANFGDALKIGGVSVFWVNLSFVGGRGAYVPSTSPEYPPILEPGWLPACSGCYAAPNVDGSIPKLLTDAGGQCIVDEAAIGWSQFPCTQLPFPVPVLCEREPPGSYALQCNGGLCLSIPSTAGRKRYLFALASATADQASSACRDLGGSLVVFESTNERESVLREVVRALQVDGGVVAKQAWIGYASNDAGVFQWDADGGMTRSPWGDDQPTADASLPARAYVDLDTDDYDLQLAHDDTNVPRPYICQY